MDFLFDPNIAYLLLVGGLVIAALALASPGTGVLELLALVPLVFAGWLMLSLPFHPWALVVLLVGVVLFIAAVRRPRHVAYLVASVAALVLGSAYLFRSEVWWQPAVDPLLALFVSLLSGGFFWIVARKSIEAIAARPSHDLNSLIGAVGEARTSVHQEGTVQVGGELWSARSEAPIPDGARVRVLQRDGFILVVEAVAPGDHP